MNIAAAFGILVCEKKIRATEGVAPVELAQSQLLQRCIQAIKGHWQNFTMNRSHIKLWSHLDSETVAELVPSANSRNRIPVVNAPGFPNHEQL
jgi:hypothetical protein